MMRFVAHGREFGIRNDLQTAYPGKAMEMKNPAPNKGSRVIPGASFWGKILK
jgi:hypothetical protein